MLVGAVKETVPGERRVALVPESVSKLTGARLQVTVEPGAGVQAFYPDDAYQKAGASLAADARGVLSQADALLKLQPPSLEEAAALRPGTLLVSFLQPAANAELVRSLAKHQVTAFSLELVPRISRAQGMDALSSQAGI